MAIVTTPSCTRRDEAETNRPRPGTLRHRLLTSTALALVLLAAPLAPRPAAANPLGGHVVAGTATITTPNASTLDVTQSSPRAAIDWQSFNIAPTQTTNFVQPSASSVTLNRVQAGDPSVIAGHLNANGQVILVNPSGVTFARGAQVNVNSLIATPSDISNSDFMHGRMNFDIPSKDPNARVVNRGRITVAEKGLAALVAPGAANSGVIQAKLGTVVIGGAKTFTVDFYGDGLINFAMTAPVTAVPIGADGKPVTSLVSNSGRIEAAGGTVLMTADAAAGILRNVVDVSGRVGAPTYAQTPGTVTVDAGAGNRARVSGQIDVSGYRPGQVGGTAVVTGGSVDLASTARILARGPAGGGTVMIGGGPHGADAGVRDAQATNVASGAVIDASATANGSGGNVTVWSDGTTTFNGTIFARGGPQGGDGGWVETSGRALSIDANAVVDTGALVPSGKLGTWLLDPTDLDITTTTQNTTESGGNPDTVSVTQPSDSGGAATVSNTAIEDALVNGNVVLTTVGSPASTAGNPTGETATGKITVDAPIAWMSANTLTMTAAGDIVINQPIAGAAGILILNAGGGVGQAAAGTISVAALEVSAVGPVSLGQANAVGTVAGDVTGSGNSFLLSNSAALTVNTVDGVVGITTAGGNIGLITTAGNLTLSNNVAAGTASVALQSAGEILQNGSGGITAANLEAVAVDAIALNSYNADAVGTVAGQVTGVGSGSTNSFLLANATISMTVGTVGPIDETSGAQMLSVGALSGVTTNGGNILLGPNAAGSLTLDAPVNANNGSTILGATPGQILLQAGSTITQAPGAIVVGSALLAATGGSITLTEANRIGESDTPATASGVAATAGVIAMAGSSVAFRNDRAGLEIGSLNISGAGGLSSGPFSGITATDGQITLATTTAGGIEVDQAVASGGGEIDIAAAPGSGIVNESAIGSGGGNIVLLGDSLSLGGNTPAGTIGAGAGTVVLGPSTTGDAIALGTTSSSGTLGMQTADFATITAGMVQVGYPGMTGNIDVQGSGISIGTADVPALALVTGGDVTETAGAIAYTGTTPLTLGAIAGGSVDMAQANAAGTLAGYAGGSGSAFAFLDGSTLTVGALPLQQLGVTVDGTTGLASAVASTVSTQTGALTGVTNAGGNIVLKTNAGDIDIDQPVDAGTGAIGLSSAGGINQDATSPDDGGVVGSALDIVSANSVDLTAGGVNAVGSLAAGVANSAEGFYFRNDGTTLTVDTVGAVTAGSLTVAQQSGIVTNGASPGPIDLLVFGSADLVLNQPVDANAGSTTTLGANPGQIGLIVQEGGISQAATGTIVGSALEFIANNPGTLSPATTNAVNLAAAPNLLGTSTAPGELAGNVSGSGGVAFRDTNPSGLETASLSIIETYAGITTTTNAPNGISLGTTAGPITITNGNGLTSNGGEIDVAAAPGYGITNQGAIASSGGNIVLLGDSLSLGGGTGTVTTGSTTSGTVVLGPSTTSLAIGLGAASTGTSLGLQTADFATITAGMVQVGYPSMTGNITVVGGIAPSTTNFPALALVTGSTITENSGDAIAFSGGTLGLIAGGAVSMAQANTIATLAGFAGGSGDFTFVNNAALTVGSSPSSQLGVAVDGTTGLASSASMPTGSGLPSNPLTGVTTYGVTSSLPSPGNIALEASLGGLTLDEPVNAGTGAAQLIAAGAISQDTTNGPITAGSLEALTEIAGGAAIDLDNANNAVPGTVTLTTLTAPGAGQAAAPGAITFYDSDAITIGAPASPVFIGFEVGIDTSGSALLQSAGAIGQAAGSSIVANGLEARTLDDDGAAITLDSLTNQVSDVTLSTFNAADMAVTAGGISFVDDSSFTVVAANDREAGIATTGTIVLASNLPGGLFTNSGTIDTTGQGTVAAGNDIAVLADTMGLAGGTIDAGAAGRVVLAPYTTTQAMTLVGTGGTPGSGLNLANADLATITAGLLTIGGAAAFDSGDISISGAVTLPASASTLILTTQGSITDDNAAGNTIAVANLALGSLGEVHLTGANDVGTLAGLAVGNFAFGDNATTGLTVGMVPASLLPPTVLLSGGVPFFSTDAAPASGITTVAGTITVQNAGGLTIADPVATNQYGGNGNIILETTGASGDLTLNAALAAGSGMVGLSSVGTVTQSASGTITTTGALEVLSLGQVSLGAYGGPGATNTIGKLAARVFDAGQSFVYANSGNTLRVGTVNPVTDGFGATLLDPSTGMASGAVSGVTTNNANIGLRAIGGGAVDLRIDANVAAGTGDIGLEASGAIESSDANFLSAAGLEAYAGSVDIEAAAISGPVAGRATETYDGFALDNLVGLTVGTVGPILEQGTSTAQMLSVGAISGVATQNGTIVLEAALDVALAQTVNANGFDPTTLAPTVPLDATTAGTVFLGSELGTITQDPTNGAIVAAELIVESDLRVSLGAADNMTSGAANQVAALAGIVLGPGESFVFRDDATSLTVLGIVTNDANIGVRVTNSGTLTLAGSVNAADGASSPSGAGDVGLEAPGTITQTGDGTITASALEIDAVGSGGGHDVSLPQANLVSTVAARTEGSFAFGDATTLTVGTVGPILESGTETPPNPQMLAAGAVTGITADGVTLQTTGAGSNLVLSASLSSGAGVTLDSAGSISEADGATITAPSLATASTGGTALGDTNAVPDLLASTNSGGGGFLFGDGQALTVSGAVDAGTQNLTLTAAGPLAVDAALSAGTDIALQGAGVTLAANVTGGTASDDTLSLDATTGPISQTAGTITGGTLSAQSTGGTLLGDTNEVAGLGASTNSGPGGFFFVDGQALSVSGPVDAGSQNLSLIAAGPLAVDAALDAGTDIALQGAGIALAANVTGGTASGDTLSLDATSGTLGQSAGTITGGTLDAQSTGGTSLGDANEVAGLGASTNSGPGGFFFVDGQALSVSGPVDAGSQNLSLIAAGPLAVDAALDAGTDIALQGAGIALAANVTGGTASGDTLSLDATSGTLGQSAGTITGGTLDAQSTGGTSLGDTNEVTGLGASANSGPGGFLLVDGEGLSVTGPVAAGTQNLTLTAAGPLSVDAALSADADIALQGAGIALAANVTGGTASGDTLSLDATSGTLGQSAGTITGGTLDAQSTGGTSLGDTNEVTGLGASANSGPGGFLLVDGEGLSVTGPVAAGTQNLTLTAAGPLSVDAALSADTDIALQGAGIALAANVTGGTASGDTLSLDATSGTLGQSAGTITGGTLDARSTGGTSLGDTNEVTGLGASTNTGPGGFLLVDGEALTVTGPVAAGSQNLTLTATGPLAIDAALSAGTGVAMQGAGIALAASVTAGTATGDGVTLNATSGPLGQSAGVVTGNTLAAVSTGGTSLGDANAVSDLLASTNSGSGGFLLSDGEALTVTGPVAAGSQNLVLASSGSLTVSAAVTAGGDLSLQGSSVTLAAAATAGAIASVDATSGEADESNGAVVRAPSLIVDAGGAASLGGANAVGTLAGQIGGPFEFTNAGGLTIGTVGAQSGVTTAAGDIVIATTAGDLSLAAGVNAGADDVALSASGGASESGGSVTASGLIIDAGGGVVFGGANRVATLSGAAGGLFEFVDAQALTVGTVGPVVGLAAPANVVTGVATEGGAIGLATTAGDLTLAADVDAAGGVDTAALIAGGNLAEAGGGVAASGLIANAGGTVDLDGANAVATLAGLSGGAFRFTAEGGLTIGSVAAPGGAAAGTAVFAAQSGVATTAGDVRILALGGDLVLASGVSAGGGVDNAALITAGNASEAGGIVTAAALLVRAGGDVSFATMPNAVGTLSGTATTGAFDFVDGGPLAIAAVPAIVDQPAQSGLTAGGSVLVTSQSGLSVVGNISIGAGGAVVLDANGAVIQEGGVLSITTTAATRPVLAIDATGLGADAVVARIASGPASANLIALFPPTGADNPMSLADLEAPGYATLLIGGSGAIGGRIDVLQLGVSGSGGSASLTGTVDQQSGKAAARLGVRNPFAEAFYDLNGCEIASDCFTLTLPSFVPPIQPQPVSELDVLSVLPGIDDIGVPLIEIIDSD